MMALSRGRSLYSLFAGGVLTVFGVGLAKAVTAEEAPGYSIKLVKGTEGSNAGKPAEISFNRDGDQNHTVTNAAVLLRDIQLAKAPSVMETWWGLSLGLAKDTLAKKRTDNLSLGTGIYSIWNVASDFQSAIVSSAEVFLENDREHRARGNAFLLDASLRSSRLYLDPNLATGQTGFDLRLVPSIGVYQRRISSTDDPVEAPVGHHGGVYLSTKISSRLWFATGDKKNPLFDRLSVELTAVLARDNWGSQSYSRATYRYAELSVDYLLYGEVQGKGWKPILSVSRTRGTNRIANESHKDASSVGLKISYGI